MNGERLEINISDLESFVEGRVWKLIVQMMVDKTDEQIQTLLGSDPMTSATDIARAQGMVHALEIVMDYPALLKEQVEYETEEEKRDGERRAE